MQKKINRLELKLGCFLSFKAHFLPADTQGCGLLCVGAVGQLAPVNQRSCDCAQLCGFLMNVGVDTEHLATLKPVWLRPHPSSTCARGRMSGWNCCLSKSELWLTERTRKTRRIKKKMKGGLRREGFVDVCVKMLPVCEWVPCLYVTRVCSAFGIYRQSRMTGQTNSPPIDAQRRGICTPFSRETERKARGKGRESKVNLSKSLLYGVQTESEPPQWPY